MQFGNLRNITPVSRQSTARFEFFNLEFERPTGSTDPETGRPVMEQIVPWIEVRPVGEVNRPYINAVLGHQSKNRRRLSKGKLDARMLEENREQDRELYPKHVFTGNWGGWIDADTGSEVAYTDESVRELLAQLPAEEFDELRAFCNELSNFRS